MASIINSLAAGVLDVHCRLSALLLDWHRPAGASSSCHCVNSSVYILGEAIGSYQETQGGGSSIKGLPHGQACDSY